LCPYIDYEYKEHSREQHEFFDYQMHLKNNMIFNLYLIVICAEYPLNELIRSRGD